MGCQHWYENRWGHRWLLNMGLIHLDFIDLHGYICTPPSQQIQFLTKQIVEM